MVKRAGRIWTRHIAVMLAQTFNYVTIGTNQTANTLRRTINDDFRLFSKKEFWQRAKSLRKLSIIDSSSRMHAYFLKPTAYK